MHNWNHDICDKCFKKKKPHDTPYRIVQPDEVTCCYCGSFTKSGIVIRDSRENAKWCPDRIPEFREKINQLQTDLASRELQMQEMEWGIAQRDSETKETFRGLQNIILAMVLWADNNHHPGVGRFAMRHLKRIVNISDADYNKLLNEFREYIQKGEGQNELDDANPDDV